MLAATAIAIGRLTGRAPTERQIVFEAMHSPSRSKPGTATYRGTKSNDVVTIDDARNLLSRHGIATTASRCEPARAGEAVRDLTTASADPSEVIIVVISGGSGPRPVVVSTAGTGEMMIEAPGESGVRRMETAADLLKALRGNGFEIVTATRTDDLPQQAAAWRRLRPRREAVDPADRARLHHLRNRR